MSRLQVRVTIAAALAVLGALWLAFWTLASAFGPAGALACGLGLGSAGLALARLHATAAAPDRRWRRFLAAFPAPARPAVTTVMDPHTAAAAWRDAGLPSPRLLDGPADWGCWPTAYGAAVRVQRAPGHQLADYAAAGPALAARLGLAVVVVDHATAGAVVLRLIGHPAGQRPRTPESGAGPGIPYMPGPARRV